MGIYFLDSVPFCTEYHNRISTANICYTIRRGIIGLRSSTIMEAVILLLTCGPDGTEAHFEVDCRGASPGLLGLHCWRNSMHGRPFIFSLSFFFLLAPDCLICNHLYYLNVLCCVSFLAIKFRQPKGFAVVSFKKEKKEIP